MNTELVISSGSVGESNFHLQLTPAYRQDIFVDYQKNERYISRGWELDMRIPK